MEILQIQDLDVKPFLNRLVSTFADMDRLYSEAAAYYGFNCHDCRDSCCRTHFHHHTYIEYLFIQEGVKTLVPEKQIEVKSIALKICDESSELDKDKRPVRLMCPLNFEKRCLLYPYRPMICRLHGIPYELQNAASYRMYGPGCEAFDHRCRGKKYFTFDRTPFYLEMASLENELKQAAGINGKIKLTIAEMIAGMKLSVF